VRHPPLALNHLYNLALEVFDPMGQSVQVHHIASGERAGMKGETVTRADLCEAVHEEVGLTRQDCGELVERVLELMAVALEEGAQVKLSGFGVFQVRAKRARMGRNPKTGEPAAIEPRRVIGFRASQVMKARVDRALSR
jgi:integration host factor subunit alpha